MHIAFNLIFYLTVFLCLSTYFLYPVLLMIFAKFNKTDSIKEEFLPLITIIISAYDEEKHIEQKIKNTLDVEYPTEKLEIIVGSDGSKDNTDNIVSQYKKFGVKLMSFEQNRGKTAVQNDCVNAAKGEMLVFTDAASLIDKKSIKKMVQHFVNEKVGCVAGSMIFTDIDKNITTESQSIYWKYEFLIRKLESKLGRLIGVDGPLYSIRKDIFDVLKPEAISDFISPLKVLQKGYRVILEPDAVVFEIPTIEPKQEFITRRRITVRALNGLQLYSSLLNPFKNFLLACQILFHKIIRWFVGPLLLLNLITVLFLVLINSDIFQYVLYCYIILFITAVIGYLLDKVGIKIRIFSISYYFILVNTAATFGIIDFMRNVKAVSWKPVR